MDNSDAAIDSFKQALKATPDFAVAHNNMGDALKPQGNLDAAIDNYKRALKITPDFALVHNNMGIALQEKGELDAAINSYKQAIKFKPDYAAAYNNKGNVLKLKGDLDAAVDNYKQALKITPDFAHANYNLGIALHWKGELDAAIDCYKEAIKIRPDHAETYYNIGNVLRDKGDLDAAIDNYKQAITVKPYYADAYNNMGIVLNNNGQLAAAIDSQRQAIKIQPDHAEAHLDLSFLLLNSGRLNEGFDEYEWRWKVVKNLSQKRNFSQPLWHRNKGLNGKRILLWCEQGVGDTINWSSCLPLVASRAEHCILECPQKLVPLLARSFPTVEVKTENRSLDPNRDDFEFHLPMGNLFRQFIPEISQNAKPNAFLVPDPVKVNFWRERLNSLGSGPYVGISWKSSNMSPSRLPNYAPISEWAPVLTLPDVNLINLQSKDFEGDLSKIQNELGVTVHNFNDLDHYDDLENVAALCAALDIVVSIKTTVPLISAGVGTSTKLATWRQSYWNNILVNPVGPSVDIFERNTWEPWKNVFHLIADDICNLTES